MVAGCGDIPVMNPETILVLTAEAAAGSAVRALCDNDLAVGTAVGFLAGVTMAVLPPETASAVLSVAVPFAASQLTHKALRDELKEGLRK